MKRKIAGARKPSMSNLKIDMMKHNIEKTMRRCSACNKPATNVCNGCKGLPGYDSRPIERNYCSEQCLKVDWPDHKLNCKRAQLRESFFRAGAVLQDVFYIFRESMFDMAIRKVEQHLNGTIYIHQLPRPPVSLDVEMLQPLSKDLELTDEQKHAILSYGAGEDALVWLYPLADKLLNHLHADISELVIDHRRDAKHPTIRIDQDGQRFSNEGTHVFWGIRLQGTEEDYALDLAGAQYGYPDPVTPFKRYEDTRFHSLGRTPDALRVFGAWNNQAMNYMIDRPKSPQAQLYWMNKRVRDEMMRAVEEFEMDNSMSFGRMFASKEEKFIEQKEAFVRRVGDAIWKARNGLEEHAVEVRAE
ncbi:hypothetical protein B0J14DRAFT_277971 [Halenospora varia]|nr:hypothetical protein B0J14DRAFT_277971 [Halenospora varia]